MRKKKSEILNIIKEEIISNYKSYILVIILFSVGLFLGVLFIIFNVIILILLILTIIFGIIRFTKKKFKKVFAILLVLTILLGIKDYQIINEFVTMMKFSIKI